ncbi:flagellar basal body-associated FliL family protein [Cellulomonas edaphi]|uniref:Flagellar protein FliL n=1 Tax=Cellulomonas edaphi TaxID=3053468 RepID=A0ABT7S4N0_9CELL|nr:flagellar basal body-associated FliL family protein [Cellulomons edaphi]MDM7830555.1 flagellar basal body-associated FliL family protein [Cellulomons edaphi]
MPIEQRVVSGPKIAPKIGGKIGGASSAPAAEAEASEPKRSKKKLVLLVVPVVLVALGAAWFFLLRPSGAAGPEAEPKPEPGEVLAVDPVSLNLAGGHYLRLGIALQLTTEVTEAPDTSRAIDHAISVFSGRTVEDVSNPKTREKLRDQLAKELATVYEGEVMGVYLTNYVTQ